MATVGTPSFIEEKSAESATLGTTIRILKKDIAEIKNDIKAASAATKAAREANDEVALAAARAQTAALYDELNRNVAQLAKAEGEKSYIDANIARLQQREKELAAEEKAPIPITAESNPSGIPTGPTSTITEGNRNAPLPVAAPTNLAQTAATTNEAIQDKKPTQIDELSAYPPNTVAQRSTEIDEDSAYPPNPVDQKPTEIDELSAYPPNTVAQRSTEIDEDSAYPPNPVDVAAKAQLLAGVGRTAPGEALKGLTAQQLNTNSQATQQDTSNFAQKKDWRVKLSLAPGATYLYKNANPGILAPLQATNGVIFPYTPAITVAYNASYDPTDLTHSNYKYFTYRGSAVDSISLGCEFTAQDTTEAAYLLAVIHFFKSVTKMFYGQDKNPIAGTPPPLCYLTGLGTFQFDNHPLVITSFTYTLPVDVDYIQTSGSSPPGVNTAPGQSKGSPNVDPGSSRRDAGGLNTGAVASPPNFTSNTGAASGGASDPTYVPTKMQITIGAVPIVTRADISNTFSLEKYATGELLRGSQRKGGGIW
jgi:hypothetical protein